MKILCTLLIALLCALGLSACGNNGTDTPDTQQNQTEPDATAPEHERAARGQRKLAGSGRNRRRRHRDGRP